VTITAGELLDLVGVSMAVELSSEVVLVDSNEVVRAEELDELDGVEVVALVVVVGVVVTESLATTK